MPANGVHIQLRVAGDAQGGCGFGLQRGLAALLMIRRAMPSMI